MPQHSRHNTTRNVGECGKKDTHHNRGEVCQKQERSGAIGIKAAATCARTNSQQLPTHRVGPCVDTCGGPKLSKRATSQAEHVKHLDPPQDSTHACAAATHATRPNYSKANSGAVTVQKLQVAAHHPKAAPPSTQPTPSLCPCNSTLATNLCHNLVCGASKAHTHVHSALGHTTGTTRPPTPHTHWYIYTTSAALMRYLTHMLLASTPQHSEAQHSRHSTAWPGTNCSGTRRA